MNAKLSMAVVSFFLMLESNTHAQNAPSSTQQSEQKCDNLQGNAKDICNAQKKGQQKIADAQAKLNRNNTPKSQLDLAQAQADAKYDVDKARCGAQVGDAKSACEEVAKAERNLSTAKAKQQSLAQAASTGNTSSGASGSQGASASGNASGDSSAKTSGPTSQPETSKPAKSSQ